MFLSLFCRSYCSIFIFLKVKLISEYFPTQNLHCLLFPRTKYPNSFHKHSRLLQSVFNLLFQLCLSVPVFLNLTEHICYQSFLLPTITFFFASCNTFNSYRFGGQGTPRSENSFTVAGSLPCYNPLSWGKQQQMLPFKAHIMPQKRLSICDFDKAALRLCLRLLSFQWRSRLLAPIHTQLLTCFPCDLNILF